MQTIFATVALVLAAGIASAESLPVPKPVGRANRVARIFGVGRSQMIFFVNFGTLTVIWLMLLLMAYRASTAVFVLLFLAGFSLLASLAFPALPGWKEDLISYSHRSKQHEHKVIVFSLIVGAVLLLLGSYFFKSGSGR
jgi:hypothetical protein